MAKVRYKVQEERKFLKTRMHKGKLQTTISFFSTNLMKMIKVGGDNLSQYLSISGHKTNFDQQKQRDAHFRRGYSSQKLGG